MVVGNDTGSGNDFQGLSAIADGTPYIRMTAVNPFVWHREQGKTWTTLSNTISNDGVTDLTFSACVPPGSYTLQFWDVCGGGGLCASGGGFNAGTPPATTYRGGWEIGDPSRLLPLVAGQETQARVYVIHSNVPTSDNFYGAYALWTYGACTSDAQCPSGTNCANGACHDLGYDVGNCGSIGNACDGGVCCASACTDLSSDANNCGGCGVVCGTGSTCSSGQCTGTVSGGGILAAAVERDFAADPTGYNGVFAIANGTPHLEVGQDGQANWPSESAKTWTTLNGSIFSQPTRTAIYAVCVPPGNYTLQYWNDGCINNTSGCGTYNNGTPPSLSGGNHYLWQIGDASTSLAVAAGGVTGVNLVHTQTNVPAYDNFYGSFALWSYGGCGTFCPPSSSCQVDACPTGTTCYQGACYDEGFDTRNCGSGGHACTAESCCSSACVDISGDPNNCGGCGIVCDGGSCAGSVCQ